MQHAADLAVYYVHSLYDCERFTSTQHHANREGRPEARGRCDGDPGVVS